MRRVDHGEVALGAMLEIFHARKQHAGIADQRASRLQQDVLAPSTQRVQQCGDVAIRRRRLLVLIADAQAATEIEMLELDAFGGEPVDQPEHLLQGVQERD